MQNPLSRRRFLGGTLGAGVLSTFFISGFSRCVESAETPELNLALVDFHVHLDNSTLEKVLQLSRDRGVKFGIVEHAGTKENRYPVVLSNDSELSAYLRQLENQPVYKGVQAEWIDWMQCFSPELLGQLDYVLSDAMTFPGSNGQRRKLWERGADLGDAQQFMDRYVDWHVEIMAKEPLDILANTSWLPESLAPQSDSLWTNARIERVVEAAVHHQIALEISSSYKLPKLPFLKIAKSAGAKFSFGSNGRYPNMGKLDYCIEMAQALGLKQSDLFTPAPAGKKPFQMRKSS
jgi:histidinol phosphatase-like PHP family hydrolase